MHRGVDGSLRGGIGLSLGISQGVLSGVEFRIVVGDSRLNIFFGDSARSHSHPL